MSSLVSNVTKAATTAATAATDATTSATTTAAKDPTSIAQNFSKELETLLSNLAGDTQQVLHVYSYDTHTRVIKEKACIAMKNADPSKMKLSDVRELLVSEKVLEPRLLWSTFCNQRGAKVLDSHSFQAYLDILNEKSSEAGEIAADNADTYRVYLRYEDDQVFFPWGGKVIVDNKIASVSAAEQPKAPQVPTTFSHNIFTNPNTTFAVVHPADMSEKHWSVVIRNNSLLNAHQVVEVDGKVGKVVERSMHTAFILKPRPFLNYQISDSAASDSIAKQKQMLRIPRFRIEDDSYVEQFEKTKSVSRAIAQSSLSQTAAEMAVSGGAFGYKASASASYSENNSSSTASTSSEDTKVLTITYNFPRVVVDLDSHSLDLTEECNADLLSVDSAAGIASFKDKYGRFFATRVQLGGRLLSSEDITATTSTAKSDQAKAMKAAAALSFSSPYVQASAKMSSDKSSTSSSDASNAASTKSMCWEAKGGDTLLCNDPPAWAATVGSFYSWRAVKQSKVVALEDVISTIPGYQYIKQKFADILKNDQPTMTTVSVGFQISHGPANKLLTVNPTTTETDTVETFETDGSGRSTNTLAMTAERYDYLLRLNAITTGSEIVGLSSKATISDSQNFYVDVATSQGNEVKQLKYNYPYCIYNKSSTTDSNRSWLVSSPTLPGYVSTSLVYASTKHIASAFQFRSTTIGDASEYITSGSRVNIVMFDHNGTEIGKAARQPHNGDRVGVDSELSDLIKLDEFTLTYV
ncbi:hypothetical protein BO83DRAFT_443955 [Aspergillus eucalypticola CBS 122712]|uniref:MACPF-like domain-containing protein n=1 Tax=Aspergillus eucalypticola (strain CBS 122712 / IBT 29274) TaxID=1448314 RepID=A0A317VPT3_ASPEC|nr:uncharacterized protein BO83DRAFT_443955 [Aspergillus eucalypticola CBS 122712]PWY74888.1 hypothetical protein BO83DRAFT_443955 [Aspergillus eucalypticola CBS 122712]